MTRAAFADSLGSSMQPEHASFAKESPEPPFDRRRGPRRGSEAGDVPVERRENERRNTPGVDALLEIVQDDEADLGELGSGSKA